jgi:hypothetical protein
MILGEEVQVWSNLLWHHAHTKFQENLFSYSPDALCGQTDGQNEPNNTPQVCCERNQNESSM